MAKFKTLNNISFKEQFALYISITSIVVVAITAVAMFVVFSNKNAEITENAKNEIYVMVDDLVLKAIRSQDFKDNIEASTKGAIRLFQNYFWSLEPYESYINENHDIAFDMGDASVKQLRKYLNDEGFYNNILSGKYSTRLILEPQNIEVDFSHKPYTFVSKGKLVVYRSDDVVTHNLITRGEISSKEQTDNNFTGYFIRDYKVSDFKVINTEKYGKGKTNRGN